MDLSKLPRMSSTDAPAPAAPPESHRGGFCDQCGSPMSGTSKFCASCGAPRTAAASNAGAPLPGFDRSLVSVEGIVCLLMGLMVGLMLPRWFHWVSSVLFGTYFAPWTDARGNPVQYTQLPEFCADMAPALLAIVLVLHGAFATLYARPVAAWIMLFVTAAMALFNLWWVVWSYSTYGLAPWSAIAVIVSVKLIFTHLMVIRAGFAPSPAV